MIEVKVKRLTPPIESVTLTVDLDTARAIRHACGLGTIHVNIAMIEARTGMPFADFQRITHPVSMALMKEGVD